VLLFHHSNCLFQFCYCFLLFVLQLSDFFKRLGIAGGCEYIVELFLQDLGLAENPVDGTAESDLPGVRHVSISVHVLEANPV
jgi:hypothetical protein